MIWTILKGVVASLNGTVCRRKGKKERAEQGFNMNKTMVQKEEKIPGKKGRKKKFRKQQGRNIAYIKAYKEDKEKKWLNFVIFKY